jgi:hypothetical protein
MPRALLVPSFAALALAAACGGRVPAVSADRESGQSGLMDKTFAGAHKCDPKGHARPFVIEWDATDMSQFEAVASGDVVFVKYQGCDLQVVDSCRNDSLKGSLGSYRSVDWTSGSIEKIDVKNEGELYAKLPLGAASLGGRVAAGESFLMEYFVAGTRTATRPSQLKAELAKVPGCRGVTHFVYSYNLGAFALGSTKNIRGEVNSSVWGVDAGGSSKYASAAEKKGGVLASCRGETVKEVETCKTPIRLTLREIEDGDAPAVAAGPAPAADPGPARGATPLNLNAKAGALANSARQKAEAGDGKGCLADLDAADAADPRPDVLSTLPKNGMAEMRGRCLMLAGQCDAGKLLYRKFWEDRGETARADGIVQAAAVKLCPASKLPPRDVAVKANQQLIMASVGAAKLSAAECQQNYETVKKVRDSVKDDGEDSSAGALKHAAGYAWRCAMRAGDCKMAFAFFADDQEPYIGSIKDPAAKAERLKKNFASQAASCKDK